MQDETLKFEDNSMQNSLTVTRFQSDADRLPVQRKNNAIQRLTSIVVILPQALVFAAASGVEANVELYTAVFVGTILLLWPIAHCFYKPQNSTHGRVTSTLPK
jgi:MFS superfamily sulfate permease-like transporter